MPNINTRQTVMAVCDDYNSYDSPLSIAQIRQALRDENNGAEPSDSDVLDWLSDNAEWTSGTAKANEITYRDNAFISLDEEN